MSVSCRRSIIAFYLLLTLAMHTQGICLGATRQALLDNGVPAGVEALSIINLHSTSGRTYDIVESGFAVRGFQYVDREFRFTAVPDVLIGATYIKTANDDKASRGTDFVSFEVNAPVIVYVAHDNRAESKPFWISEFTPAGISLRTDDKRSLGFNVFKKRFAPGKVVLGGNSPDKDVKSMYTIVVVPDGIDNLAPMAHAGMDQKIWLPRTTVLLHGGAKDDGRPSRTLSYLWSSDNDAGKMVFSNAVSLTTGAVFSEAGTHELRLTVSDGELSSTDTVRIEVLPEPDPFYLAGRNARQANEGWRRCRRFLIFYLQRRLFNAHTNDSQTSTILTHPTRAIVRRVGSDGMDIDPRPGRVGRLRRHKPHGFMRGR